jgi:hypothetical protein
MILNCDHLVQFNLILSEIEHCYMKLDSLIYQDKYLHIKNVFILVKKTLKTANPIL